jgi:Helix-turn-helix.
MNTMDTISNRIQKAMSIRDMKQADLVKRTKIGKSSISTYISGDYEPKPKNIEKLAEALNVSEDWLRGKDVPMDRVSMEQTGREDFALLLDIHTLSSPGRQRLRDMLKRKSKEIELERIERIERLNQSGQDVIDAMITNLLGEGD